VAISSLLVFAGLIKSYFFWSYVSDMEALLISMKLKKSSPIRWPFRSKCSHSHVRWRGFVRSQNLQPPGEMPTRRPWTGATTTSPPQVALPSAMTRWTPSGGKDLTVF
jgi:hypothetical protein